MKFRGKAARRGADADVDGPRADDGSGSVDAPATDGAPASLAAAAEGSSGGSASEGDYREAGPWDLSEVDADSPDRIDLGSLLIPTKAGFELQLQVDEASKQVASALLVSEQGAVELRAFAAPRNGDIWVGVRKEIAAEAARLGGTATEAEGSFGVELHLLMPVRTPDGELVAQGSRVLGVCGPRWLLRATMLGRAAVDAEAGAAVEAALRDVVVVRGKEPMAPGDALALHLPSNATPVPPPVT